MRSISNNAQRKSGQETTAQAAAFIAALIFILLFAKHAEAQATHDHADIRAAAEAHARTVHATPGGRLDVIANTLDARVRLTACDEPLQTSIPHGNKPTARVTVAVKCASPKPWKIYVPVRAAIFRQVVVAARPLARGSILTANDIMLTESDTSQLARGYIASNEQAVGHKLRRAVTTGDAITPGVLETPAMIRRGQRVSLQARSGALTVRVAGIAKSDGMLGQVIEFENQSSKRPVQAIIRSPQSAEILLQ